MISIYGLWLSLLKRGLAGLAFGQFDLGHGDQNLRPRF
jgi:hypothetical protein